VFERVLIANRGEIAVRIARTCRELGVASIAVYSDLDAGSRHAAAADASIPLRGATPPETYLNAEALIAAARASGAQAIHPGYGFLAEDPLFAEEVAAAGLAWIGPPAEVTRAVGDKIHARRIARAAGVPVIPGLLHPVESVEEAQAFGADNGFPVVVKAAGGGGGRGLKIARAPEELADALTAARRESEAYFGSRDVYVERYLESPKHLEVQVLAPAEGDALWLGLRDCSLQRRHQKLVEETPPPRSSPETEMGEAAVAMAKECGYVNAGTVEFLLDEDGHYFFLEVNARLQVEHTVTEEVYGVDLVASQLRVAAGEPLGLVQADLAPRGHAMQCRINAEDPAADFAPSPGRIVAYAEPGGPGVRVDSGYAEGDRVPAAYDSLIAKLVVWDGTREGARRRMLRALDEMRIEGIETTIPAARLLVESREFVSGSHTTTTVDSGVLEPLRAAARPSPSAGRVLAVGGREVRLWAAAMAPSASAGVAGGAPRELLSPMQGTIVAVLVAPGERVEAGTPMVVLEAMKMETTLGAPVAGRVAQLSVSPGDTTSSGSVIARIE
jgi:acetyl-CoA/propionyl-CoA carboxylase biotin carboxyl carrier protein